MESDQNSVRESLEEIGKVTASLLAANHVAEAIAVGVRGLGIRKRVFGDRSIEFQTGRVELASVVLHAAKLHQAHDKLKEAAELLSHVDNLTIHSFDEFPMLNRRRLLLRTAMLRELMIARQSQGRHRSALTFGRHLLVLAKKMLLDYELPAIHLNLAAVLSSMKLHDEALGHCYLAYKIVCQLLSAIDNPTAFQYSATILEMEKADKRQAFDLGFENFEQALVQRENNVHETEIVTSPPAFEAHVAEDESVSALSFLLWSGNVAVQTHRVAASGGGAASPPRSPASLPPRPQTHHTNNTAQSLQQQIGYGLPQSRFPCIELAVGQQSLAREAVREQARAEGHARLTEQHRRWGGLLALIFRSIAVEQEHTNQSATALLTYKVAHTTALQCLGDIHPVTMQCLAAMRDAEAAIQSKEQQRSYLRLHQSLRKATEYDEQRQKKPTRPPTVENTVNVLTSAHRPPLSGAAAATAGGGKGGSDSADVRPRAQTSQSMRRRDLASKLRPPWNQWFNSETPPRSALLSPLELRLPSIANDDAGEVDEEERGGHADEGRAADNNTNTLAQTPLGNDPRHRTSTPDVSSVAASHRAATAPLPGDGSSLGPVSSGAPGAHRRGLPRRDVATPATRHRGGPSPALSPIPQLVSTHRFDNGDDGDDGEDGFRTIEVGLGDEAFDLPPVTAEDYAFLQQTFRLRHDPSYGRRPPALQPIQPRKAGLEGRVVYADRELRALRVEQRLAERLAAEVGVSR